MTVGRDDDWFDPLLSEDTQLFIDPFLIFSDRDPIWQAAHGKVVGFFNEVMKLVARSGFKRTSAHWQKAERLLLFPEPAEFCLGYSEASTLGSGAGKGLRNDMLEGARDAITRGVESVDHLEEITLFGGGIGADRISGIVANVLKEEFAAYTQEVAARHGVPLSAVGVRHAAYDARHLRWLDSKLDLPLNQLSGRGVLLVPRRFLRHLPTMDASDFWSYAWTNENETIRRDFNYEIGKSADSHEIARFARRRPEIIKAYVEWRETQGSDAYDLADDPDLRVQWFELGSALASHLAMAPASSAGFHDAVAEMVQAFKSWVEDQDGWRVLHNESTGRRIKEKYIQSIFKAMVILHCRTNDIDVSGESNAGRGPVDFKFSRGWHARALVEIKPIDNPRFRHGVTKRLPAYLEAEQVFVGYFVAIGFTDEHLSDERKIEIRNLAASASRSLGKTVEAVFIDARPKKPASRS